MRKMISMTREIIRHQKKAAEKQGRPFGYHPDEVALNRLDGKEGVRRVLDVIGSDLFEMIRATSIQSVDMPEPPSFLVEQTNEEIAEQRAYLKKKPKPNFLKLKT